MPALVIALNGADLAAMRTPYHDDIPLQIGDLIRKGVIASVDLNSGLATVKVGDVMAPPLPWCEMSGTISTWCPPSVNEQVLILCMEGDIESGVILRGLSTTAFPHPATGEVAHLKMPDGTSFDYDWQTHALTITVAAGGKVRIVSPVEIEGDVKITGKLDATGKIKSDDDVLAGPISLKGHKHGSVSAGVAKTAVPE